MSIFDPSQWSIPVLVNDPAGVGHSVCPRETHEEKEALLTYLTYITSLTYFTYLISLSLLLTLL